MKSLIDYIKESLLAEQINESSITFNFDGMDDADEVIKKFDSFDIASVDDKKVEVVADSNLEELKKIYDILKEYSNKERNSQHRSSDEQYAQKTIKFADKVDELAEMIDKIENPDTPEDDEKKSDDKKKEEE